jgi:hypothetical protein
MSEKRSCCVAVILCSYLQSGKPEEAGRGNMSSVVTSI